MTVIRAGVLNQTVTVTPRTGRSSYGPLYGTPRDMRCRIEPKRELIRDSDGAEIVSSARMFTMPDETLGHGDKVDWVGNSYRIVSVAPMAALDGETHHLEVMLA